QLLARAARRAELRPDERAKPVLLVHQALRSLNRLDRAVALAVRGEPARLEPWRRQFLRVAALLGELDVPERELERDLLPWAGTMASFRDRRRDAERQALQAARIAKQYLGLPEQRGTEELALRTGHPAWFVGIAQQMLGRDARALLQANNEDPPLVVRTNTLRATRPQLVERLKAEGFEARPTRWSPLGLIVEPKEGAFRAKSFREGWFEAQDEGSQLLALLVGAEPGQWVLDACAGAGGKTLLLAAQMRNKGRVVALDTHQGRLLDLKRRAARAGADNYEALVVAEDGEVKGGARALRAGAEPARSSLPRKQYDAVLVDAPCSGLGTLRRTPELRWRHDPASLAAYPPRQLAILEQQVPRVKPGGRLVYATCTIHPDEDEGVVQKFLAAHPGFTLRSAAACLPAEVRTEGLVDSSGFLRLWPHRHGTEGFFGAVLQRAD
ncbi:MAG: RsmB/NOP family class I SAM-dependent RNA methyltransferase, partial [Halobacteriales archaeon]|nr:RsmB/NOP family class I SAM-dependent RNA methyltransferase [Halobacteriales archaeon]